MIPVQLPTGAEEMTISSTSKSLLTYIREAASAPDWKPERANSVQIQVKTNSIRYSVSFTPTTANGMLVSTSGAGEWIKAGLDKIFLIRNGGSDATITIQVFEDNLNR